MSKKASENVYVNATILAARGVERSQDKHHTALMEMMTECHRAGPQTTKELLSEYCANRVREAKDTLCTKGTFAWLAKHWHLRVSDAGVVKYTNTFPGQWDVSNFNAARAEPWYELAKALAFKLTTDVNYTAVAAQLAKMMYAGAEPPSRDKVFDDVMAAIKKYEKGNSFAEWRAEFDSRMEAGEIDEDQLSYIRHPETKGHPEAAIH